MKIKAYTIMEVTIAMLLFAIVVSICYTAYGIVNTNYNNFRERNNAVTGLSALKNVLEHDFTKSNCILKDEDGFVVLTDTTKIKYSFKDQRILRVLNNIHTDSFELQFKEPAFYFQSNAILKATDTIDQINFNIILERVAIPIQVNKQYSAKDLFR